MPGGVSSWALAMSGIELMVVGCLVRCRTLGSIPGLSTHSMPAALFSLGLTTQMSLELFPVAKLTPSPSPSLKGQPGGQCDVLN